VECEKVACWSTKAAIFLKRVKTEEKLVWGPIGIHQRCFDFFGSPPSFYFRFRVYGHRDGRFCLFYPYSPSIGTRWYKWTFWLQTMCVLSDCASRGHLCDSTAFLFFEASTHTDRHTVTRATDHPTHVSATASVRNKGVIVYS